MSLVPNIIFLFFIAPFVQGKSFPFDTVLIDEMQDENERIDLTPLGTMLFSEPDEAVGRAVSDWDPSSDQNPEELGTYVEGDMLIPGVEGRNGLVHSSSKWPGGVVPYVISSSFSSKDMTTIMKAFDIYRTHTCINFVKRTNEKDYISIESKNTGCWSSVGKIGRKQSLNLQSPGCTSRIGTTLHELMHALGFVHEQNRADRDDHVRVIFANIKPSK